MHGDEITRVCDQLETTFEVREESTTATFQGISEEYNKALGDYRRKKKNLFFQTVFACLLLVIGIGIGIWWLADMIGSSIAVPAVETGADKVDPSAMPMKERILWVLAIVGFLADVGALGWIIGVIVSFVKNETKFNSRVGELLNQAKQQIEDYCQRLRDATDFALDNIAQKFEEAPKTLEKSLKARVTEGTEGVFDRIGMFYRIQVEELQNLIANFETTIDTSLNSCANGIQTGFTRFTAKTGTTADKPIRNRFQQVDQTIDSWLNDQQAKLDRLKQDLSTLKSNV